MEFNRPNVIDYNKAMEIVNTGKYYDANKNLICDYCMTSNLQGSWKILIDDDIDLCMNCFIKLRNGNNNGQKTLPTSGKINNFINQIGSTLSSMSLSAMTYMMQDSVQPIRRSTLSRMMQDSVRMRVQTKMKQDSVRSQSTDVITKMRQDSVHSRKTADNVSGCSINSNGKFTFID